MLSKKTIALLGLAFGAVGIVLTALTVPEIRELVFCDTGCQLKKASKRFAEKAKVQTHARARGIALMARTPRIKLVLEGNRYTGEFFLKEGGARVKVACTFGEKPAEGTCIRSYVATTIAQFPKTGYVSGEWSYVKVTNPVDPLNATFYIRCKTDGAKCERATT